MVKAHNEKKILSLLLIQTHEETWLVSICHEFASLPKCYVELTSEKASGQRKFSSISWSCSVYADLDAILDRIRNNIC